jgi:hypothetical protein
VIVKGIIVGGYARTHSFVQRSFIFLTAIIAAHHFLLVYRDRDGRMPRKLREVMQSKDRVNSPLASHIRTIMPGLKFPFEILQLRGTVLNSRFAHQPPAPLATWRMGT